MTNKYQVKKWINKNFNTDEIETEDMPLLPGGTIIKDKAGATMLVYYDILLDKVVYKI